MKRSLYLIMLVAAPFAGWAQSNISNDTLHWSEHRKLGWNDFQGEAIQLPGYSGEIFCMNLANFQKPSAFLPTKWEVVSVFDRQTSWSNPEAQSEQTLLFFQTMFNLYELYARRLRKEYSETKFGMNPNQVFQEKYTASQNALIERIKQFRTETKMGLELTALQTWNTQIDQELQALENYKDK